MNMAARFILYALHMQFEKRAAGWLHEWTVGESPRAVARFLRPLDKTFVSSLRAVENMIDFKRQKNIDPEPKRSKRRAGYEREAGLGATRAARRAAGKVFDAGADFAEGLSPIILQRQRKRDTHEANRKYRQQGEEHSRDR